METNKIKERSEEQSKKKENSWMQRTFESLGVGSAFDLEWLSRNFIFILFIALLAWFHIGNNHKAVNYIRSINKMEREIKELRWEYMTEKSELMHDSKQSEVAIKVKKLGLEELTEPPHIIEVE
ncbi:MAG: hypothetical protein HKN92_01270 [Chitinophagales bacterium]|nr:hypothetical protein [Chitinophagales bacterium]